MIKNPIGILDMGLEGIDLLYQLSEHFRNENFIYINDLIGAPYEGRTPDEIAKFVENNVNLLLSFDIKMLLVVSDTIVEYCSDILKSVKVPVLSIVDLMVEYVNKNYELKNMALLAKDGVLKANLYQKDFHYNHLYQAASDNLEKIILNNQTKTSKSFQATHDTFKNIPKRDIEVLIVTLSYLSNLRIEIDEYITVNNIVYPATVFIEKITHSFSKSLNVKGKGKVYILSQVPKKDFMKRIYWQKIKCKYYNVTDSKPIKVK